MGFGNSANTKKNTEMNENRENPFLDTKNGIRIFRLPTGSEEIRVKRYWLAQNDDGKYEPKFGYNPNDKRKAFPVIVAYYSAHNEKWIGHTANWRANPLDAFVKGLDTEDQKGKYAQEVFFLNVLDLTPVYVDSEGNVFYPNDTMKYPSAPKTAKKQISGKVRILSGSAGDPDGKSLYANLLRMAKMTMSDEGEIIPIYDYEIRLITSGSGKDTNRNFSMGKIAPMPVEYATVPVYDLTSMVRPWPNEALESLLEGRMTYPEALKEYEIVTYPKLLEPATEDEENLF
jgi:hypothetical protein